MKSVISRWPAPIGWSGFECQCMLVCGATAGVAGEVGTGDGLQKLAGGVRSLLRTSLCRIYREFTVKSAPNAGGATDAPPTKGASPACTPKCGQLIIREAIFSD